MKDYTWLAVLLLLVGTGCIFSGVSIFMDNQTFLRTAAISSATVMSSPEPGIRVSFIIKNGSEKTKGLDPQFSYKVGDTVRVAYQLSNPDEVRICTFWEMNFGPACLLTISVLFTGIGIFLFSAAHSERKPRTRTRAGFLGIPAELIEDKFVAEALARDPVFGKQVHVSHQEHIEIEDAVSGTKRVYSSFDEVPPDIQAKLDAIRDRYGQEKTSGAATETYIYRDELTGEEKTYHSLDEMPPPIRRFFENLGKGEWPGPE